jgi:hypothetical protein
MNGIRIKRWMEHPEKAHDLARIVNDPVFLEAADLVMAMNIPRDPEDSSYKLGYVTGISDAFRFLETTSTLTLENKEKVKMQPRPKPWGHIEEEQSAFSATPKTS